MSSKRICISTHAEKQLKERNISPELLLKTLLTPTQLIDSHSSRKIAQSLTKIDKEEFVVRVVFEETELEIKVITVYLTNKTKKYWR